MVAAGIVQQILENLIAPRILGSFRGLNPVWVLISILAGARVGGLLGVIVAVPIAVIIKTALMALRSPIIDHAATANLAMHNTHHGTHTVLETHAQSTSEPSVSEEAPARE